MYCRDYTKKINKTVNLWLENKHIFERLKPYSSINIPDVAKSLEVPINRMIRYLIRRFTRTDQACIRLEQWSSEGANDSDCEKNGDDSIPLRRGLR